ALAISSAESIAGVARSTPRFPATDSLVLPAALAVLVAAALGLRLEGPRYLERRVRRRLPLDADGIVVGGAPITLSRPAGPAALLLHGAGDTPQVLGGLASHLYD